ncbi:MAG: RsmE family RNA methyltransferase [bacterium]|nr:RsmE family RNA methyltransferase [bacterium]
MKIRTRLYHPRAGASPLRLDDEDARAVAKVLRLAAGDVIACFNGDGNEHLYRIDDVHRHDIGASLIESHPNPSDELRPLNLWIAASKGKNLDRMVRDLTPLGVTALIFFTADRSVRKPEPKQQERLHKITIESCRQSGRSTIPEVQVIDKPLDQSFAGEPANTLLFWENLAGRKNELSADANVDTLIFGPEGGFSTREIDWARENRIPMSGLGARILRSELAVVVGTTLIQQKRRVLLI